MNYNFSDRISGLQPSAIREILKFTSDPNVISFAAGNPAPEAFPIDEAREITAKLFEKSPVDILQYGVTEGYGPLRERVLKMLKDKYDIGKVFDNIIITCGAQQVVDLATKVFCNEGDVVICENPSFIGSLNCFRSYNVKLKGIDIEDDGINIEALEKALQEEKNVKLIYTIPNFQNPSGVTMSYEKRKALYNLAVKYNVLIIEDNPYGNLRVSGENIPSIKTFDTEGAVIYAGSFSKLFSPGIRVGYVVAPAPVISKMTVGKQVSDVHTTMFSQMLVNEWLANYDINKHIEKMQDIYRKKLNLMCDMIDSELSDYVTYVKPEGGLFVWCKLIDRIEMMDFSKKAVQNFVAVVPGTAFLTDESQPSQYIRLNFSTPSDENIIKGMKILGNLAKEY